MRRVSECSASALSPESSPGPETPIEILNSDSVPGVRMSFRDNLGHLVSSWRRGDTHRCEQAEDNPPGEGEQSRHTEVFLTTRPRIRSVAEAREARPE